MRGSPERGNPQSTMRASVLQTAVAYGCRQARAASSSLKAVRGGARGGTLARRVPVIITHTRVLPLATPRCLGSSASGGRDSHPVDGDVDSSMNKRLKDLGIALAELDAAAATIADAAAGVGGVGGDDGGADKASRGGNSGNGAHTTTTRAGDDSTEVSRDAAHARLLALEERMEAATVDDDHGDQNWLLGELDRIAPLEMTAEAAAAARRDADDVDQRSAGAAAGAKKGKMYDQMQSTFSKLRGEGRGAKTLPQGTMQRVLAYKRSKTEG